MFICFLNKSGVFYKAMDNYILKFKSILKGDRLCTCMQDSATSQLLKFLI